MTNNNIYFIANWKMFGSIKSVNSLNKVISYSKIKKLKVKIIYCPPYTLIKSFVDKTRNSNIKINGYSFSEEDLRLDLFITHYDPSEKIQDWHRNTIILKNLRKYGKKK